MNLTRLTVIAPIVAALILTVTITGTAHAGMLTDFEQLGQQFWHDRDVQPCPDARLIIVQRPAGQEADGALPGGLGTCDIELRDGLVEAAIRERWHPRYGGDSERVLLCTTIVHELGHTAGLEHTATGLMSPVGGEAPWECRAWVARAVRSERASASRRARTSTTARSNSPRRSPEATGSRPTPRHRSSRPATSADCPPC